MIKQIFSDAPVKFFISSIGLIAIFSVLKELHHIFIPFVIAYFLFFMFQPFNNFLARRKIPHILVVMLDILIMVLVLWGFYSVIAAAFNRFNRAIPQYTEKLNHIVQSTAAYFGIDDQSVSDFDILDILNQTLDFGGIAGGFFSSTLSFVSTVFFVLFFFIFISGGHNKIVDAIRRRYLEHRVEKEFPEDEKDDAIKKIKEERSSYIDRTFKNIPVKIQNYIVTKFIISLGTASIVGLILWLFKIDFLVVWIVLTFLLNFIPNIGSIIAVILPTAIALVQYESFGYAFLIAAIISGIQNIFGNIVEPKVMGDKLGLNPLVILLSLLLWGYIWGLVGMFLSVPITAVIKILISESESPNLKFANNLMG